MPRPGTAGIDRLLIYSASGVAAAVAAGMPVVGLLDAAHIQPGHRDCLMAAGATDVAATFKEAERITRRLLDMPDPIAPC